ncbi:interferon-induced protein 44-like [Embiotoca jacksoni]|uniref:interferon-induced protein 44-like n=1 Tax=Embiotoca jacksoni TaxID=100190 RepID=UPI00370427FF
MGGALFSQPWRPLPANYQENLKFVKNYRPQNKEVKHLRILLHGPVGAGKSSFINSVNNIFQDRITGQALADAISGTSFTKAYTTYKIKTKAGKFCSLVFNDIMGFEQNIDDGVRVEDIVQVLKGHVPEGYKFLQSHPVTQNDPGYNSTPTLDDRVHVLISVFPANTISLISDEVVKKLRDVRLVASEMGIPQLAIITKVDEVCPKVKGNVKNIYKSKYLKDQVDQVQMLLGIPPNCIFLVKNYHSEMETDDDINAPILFALKQMIHFGEDFLNNQ